MGFINVVKGIISRLGKRKSDDQGGNAPAEPEAKRCKRYDLTPLEKFTPANIKKHRSEAPHYVVGEVILTTETRNFEFKSGGIIFEPKSFKELINKYGSGFLNSEGGVLLAGVLDDGTVRGVSINYRREMNLLREIQDTFDEFRPTVTTDLYCINFVPVLNKHNRHVLPGVCVVEIKIRKGKTAEIYETGDHKVYIRRDGGVQGPLRPIAIKDLAISKSKRALQEQEKAKKEKTLVKDLGQKSVIHLA